jgi:hypothetical protein
MNFFFTNVNLSGRVKTEKKNREYVKMFQQNTPSQPGRSANGVNSTEKRGPYRKTSSGFPRIDKWFQSEYGFIPVQKSSDP